MTPRTLTWREAAAWRARRHWLDERRPEGAGGAVGAVAVASAVAGLHAQVMSSAELSVWARAEGRPDVGGALWERRTLVKTWAMRGTLHLLPTSEYRTFQAALGRYRHYRTPGWLRGFGLTADELDHILSAVPHALRGRLLTREELAAAVSPKVATSWGSLLKPSSFRGELCFGPNLGQKVRFTHPETWLELGPAADPDEAAREMTRRYVSAYGPATRLDYAHWWSGLSPAQAGRLIAALGEEVSEVAVEGVPHWMPSGDDTPVGTLRSVRLLPAFDPYVIAASPHATHLLPAPAAELRGRIYRPQGWLSPVVVVDGLMEGVWRSDRKGARLVVTIELFRDLPAWARRAAAVEAERLAAFQGGTLDLRFA